MTETERIYKAGWLPKKFWEESLECGYRITSNMKKVWAVQLDLYKEFSRVCEENNLSYFTDGGSTLGAIRHEGFIPWDDDFDVCLPRKSYEQLKKLSKAFISPYFLQNVYTDSEYGYSFMRLLNENTTAILEPVNYCKFKHGIFIDIFPLDKVTLEDYLPRRKKMYDLIMKNSAYMRYDFPNKTERDNAIIEQYYDSTIILADIFDEIEKLATQDENIDTEYLSLLVSTQYDASKKIWNKKIFDDYIEKKFESITVRVPIGYDEQLHIYFGNYMEYPPLEQRGRWHNIQFYPDIPYKEFYDKKYNIKYD